MSKYRDLSIDDKKILLDINIKKINKDLYNLEKSPTLVLPNLKSCVNTGTILRICAALGFSNDVVLIGQRQYAKNLCMGAHDYINISNIIARIDDYPDGKSQTEHVISLDWDIIKNYLIEKSKNNIIIIIEQWEDSISLYDMDNKIKSMLSSNIEGIVFVLGHETYGVSDNLKDIPNSFSVEIPQYGVINSMNVAMAFNSVANEYLRTYTLKHQ